MGIEVSELGQERSISCNCGICFRTREERATKVGGDFYVYWARYLLMDITDRGVPLTKEKEKNYCNEI